MENLQALNKRIIKLFLEKPSSIERTKKILSEINAYYANQSELVILDLVFLNLNANKIDFVNNYLATLFSTYNLDGEIEATASVGLINILHKLSEEHLPLERLKVEFSYYLIFDIYFHNPGLIKQLTSKQVDRLIKEIKKIVEIKYLPQSDGYLIMTLEVIIDISFYFEKAKAENIIKSYFLTHPDKHLQKLAHQELKLNSA